MPNPDWNARVEWLLRQTGTRKHLPNNLPCYGIRADGLMLECEAGDHANYLFPVDVVCSDPPEIIEGNGNQIEISGDEHGHALIYTDSNIALTIYEACYYLWHVSRDGAYLSGGHLTDSYRLSVESVDKILAYCKAQGITFLHPACQFEKSPP